MRKRKTAGTKAAGTKTAGTKIAAKKIAAKKTASKNITAFAFALASLLFCSAAHAQIGHPPVSPTMNGSHELRITDRDMPTPVRQIDPVRLQKDALALATAAGSIPADIESIRKGILPKEIVLKLKQIEKLSKQLRNELNP
ncbi:MAG: hypothetical protein WA198_21770 [Candidatus Sulfotelmatobacter sp.]